MAKFIERRGEGIQHIRLEVNNLGEFARHLESKGRRVDKTNMENVNFPETLAGPRTGCGVVLQLMQRKVALWMCLRKVRSGLSRNIGKYRAYN